jgi:hypothetical protein
MPPELDIYVISEARNFETINRFLDLYVDREASEDRGDEELMILPLDIQGDPSEVRDWDWEPAKSLTSIVERGLQYPRRAFTVYLKQQDASLERAILSFTPDDKVIFGVSIDDEGAKPENLERAKNLLHEMAERLHGHAGLIAVEQPPPWTENPSHPNLWIFSSTKCSGA